MELSDLTVFQTVAREGGINAAATKLHRVPSNVTARIQKLEAELGKQLFLREKNRLRISPYGAQLLDYADQILALADRALLDLNQATPQGSLTIGSMESVAATCLANWLSQYHQAYPGVELSVKTQPTGDLMEQVMEGALDLAFVADPPKDSRLNQLDVIKETLVLVSDRRSPRIRHPNDLNGNVALLGFGARCAYRNRLQQWLQQSTRVLKVIEISSYPTLLSCAAAGMGVGLVTQSILDNYPSIDSLKAHKLPQKWSRSTTSLIWRCDNQAPSVQAFVELIKA